MLSVHSLVFSSYSYCSLARERGREIPAEICHIESVLDVIRSGAVSICDVTVGFWNPQCSPFEVQAKTDLCDPYSGKIHKGKFYITYCVSNRAKWFLYLHYNFVFLLLQDTTRIHLKE